MSSLSERGRYFMNFTLYLADCWKKQQTDVFDEENNPEGVINLGTSENKLMFDILMQKFSERKSVEIPEHYTHYNSFHGLESFRSKISDLLNHFMKPVKQIRANNLVVTNGCGSAVECLALVLAQPGDGILVPAPFYGGFLADLCLRAGVKAFPVKLSSALLPGESAPFELSLQRLEAAMGEAKKQNVKIRALLLCNPCNPFGTIYPEKLIRECLDFAHRNSLHVIMDEIYMLSVFGERSCLKNVLSLENIPDPSRLHVLWGFSKDFCVSGFRCGVLYSVNDEVLQASQSLSYFYSIPTVTQNLLMNLISDLEWLDNVYIPTNRRRLQECYKVVVDSLREMRIPYVESQSGFFVWVDFRTLLAKQTFEEEWKLFEAFMKAGVYIAPSKAFESPEPGWFRIIFSVKTSTLRLAMQRLSSVVSVMGSNGTQQDEICNCAQSSKQEDEAISVEGTDSTSLEDLVRTLHFQIKKSDWLETNTAEQWIEENPEHAKDFMPSNAGS